MAIYNIRTIKHPDRTSLICNVDLPDDLSAVAYSKQFLRPGETLEIWRGDKFVYRLGRGTVSFERQRGVSLKGTPTNLQLARRFGAFVGQKWSIFGIKH
jgi:hypothetical protein